VIDRYETTRPIDEVRGNLPPLLAELDHYELRHLTAYLSCRRKLDDDLHAPLALDAQPSRSGPDPSDDLFIEPDKLSRDAPALDPLPEPPYVTIR
jgi:hypothetical protein